MATLTPPQQEWLDALRSDHFPQGQGYLHHDGRYCCFGVACEVYRRHYPNGLVYGADKDTITYNGNTYYVPRIVQRWLGLRSDNGHYVLSGQYRSLIDDNDNGISFADIADIIDAQAATLFHSEGDEAAL